MSSQDMDLEMIEDIIDRVHYRMERFGELWDFAIKVILLGYGDELRIVFCTTGDWAGPKSQLAYDNRFPVCPACGNVCTEASTAPHLVLVPE